MTGTTHNAVPALVQPRPEDAPLEPRQALFCREYCIDRNGTKAAKRAGYSPHTATEQATRLLSKAHVVAEVDRLNLIRNNKLEVKADDILRQVARMALVDPRQMVDEAGNGIPLHLLPDELAMAIQAVEINQAPDGTTTYRYKLADRNSAAEKLMKHIGLFEKDNSQTGSALGALMAAVHGGGSRLLTKE